MCYTDRTSSVLSSMIDLQLMNFVQKLKNVSYCVLQINTGDIPVSYDVSSLFTNMP